MKSMNGKEYLLKAQVYVIDADTTFLGGKKTLEQTGSKLDIRKRVLETCIQGDQKDFKMITTSTEQYRITLEKLKKGEKEIMYLEEREEDLTSFASIKDVGL